eukprot:9479104-Pyramimonas_sp.AAC.1
MNLRAKAPKVASTSNASESGGDAAEATSFVCPLAPGQAERQEAWAAALAEEPVLGQEAGLAHAHRVADARTRTRNGRRAHSVALGPSVHHGACAPIAAEFVWVAGPPMSTLRRAPRASALRSLGLARRAGP